MEFRYSNKTLGMRPSIIRELLKQMSDPQLISFAGGNPAADSFPVEDIRAFSDRLLESDPVGMLQYSVTEGYGPLRTACRAFANRQWPVVKEEDEVIITSGSQQVIEFMTKLLCNEGDVVAVEEPSLVPAERLCEITVSEGYARFSDPASGEIYDGTGSGYPGLPERLNIDCRQEG